MFEAAMIFATWVMLVAFWWLGRGAFLWVLRQAADPAGPARRFGGWAARHPLRAQAKMRLPRLYGVLAARLEPRQFTGLPLTLMLVAAAYAAALFGGLVMELREAEEAVRADDAISGLFDAWRGGLILSLMLWITDLGGTATLSAVVLVAFGLLWMYSARPAALGLLVTIAGSQATTWIGKFVIARQRPEFLTEATALSPSFPSAHSSGAMAVYGFLAYVIAREATSPGVRWDVGYWAAVLIVLVGLSRIVLSVHFATDVAAGFLIGAFWLLVGFSLAEWWRGAAR